MSYYGRSMDVDRQSKKTRGSGLVGFFMRPLSRNEVLISLAVHLLFGVLAVFVVAIRATIQGSLETKGVVGKMAKVLGCALKSLAPHWVSYTLSPKISDTEVAKILPK